MTWVSATAATHPRMFRRSRADAGYKETLT